MPIILNEHVAETDNFKLHLREQSKKPVAEKWPQTMAWVQESVS